LRPAAARAARRTSSAAWQMFCLVRVRELVWLEGVGAVRIGRAGDLYPAFCVTPLAMCRWHLGRRRVERCASQDQGCAERGRSCRRARRLVWPRSARGIARGNGSRRSLVGTRRLVGHARGTRECERNGLWRHRAVQGATCVPPDSVGPHRLAAPRGRCRKLWRPPPPSRRRA
jgi:hypothetical protein